MRTRRLVVTAVLVVTAGLAACSAPGRPNSRGVPSVPKVASTTARARTVASTPRPVRSTVSAPVRISPASPPSPPSARLRLRYVTTIGGHISPKSVDASGTGLVFAQNTVSYTHLTLPTN